MARLGWALAGALSIVVILSAARAMQAGPLDPPGPVGSTLGAFSDLLPSWSRTLDATGGCNSERFQCVMSDEAVLDKETGLVWDRTPNAGFLNYVQAHDACTYTSIGGRYGWRLPTITELWSLTDDSPDDNLPDGSPFVDAGGGVYWSSTTVTRDTQYVKTLGIYGGFIEELEKPRFADDISNTWCVRGGIGLADDPGIAEQPAWVQKLSAVGGCSSPRFECVMDANAVLDRETGLVWQRTPTTEQTWWSISLDECTRVKTGGRMGWRLPSIDELMTLVDPAKVGPGAVLPTGHPFNLSGTGPFFWSTSLSPINGTDTRYLASLIPPFAGPGGTVAGQINTNWGYWCVRGGGGQPPQ
jgi:hypothetical protein